MASSRNPFGNGHAAISDDFDMNDFVNFDQGFHNSPSPTTIKMEPHQSLDPREIMLQSSSHARPQYNGPSHNYDQFRQQTGLPTGAISHVHAVNQFSNSNHVKPTNFGSAHFAGYNAGYEFADGSSTDAQGFFMPGDGADDFAVDPAAVAPDSQPSAAFRAWPGMHSEQAKQQAKAQADAQQQRCEEAVQSQQQLPSNFESTYGGRSRSQTDASEQQANEQISRLLNQMRQNSNASLDDDDDSKTQIGLSLTHGRKHEEDMDEDERLLASEEGKKLSSKERRRLRNKVSARAFRSRRKEYITQLEGEVNVKNNECNDLKITNRHLLEQNRQLTQLCKAMLNHPSFGTFMEEMSNDPSILQAFAPQSSSQSSQQSQQQQQVAQQQQQQQQQPPPTQASQTQPQHQQNIHVGMTMMPDTNLDFSMLNLGANHWNNYQQPQIYALFEAPVGPSMEAISAGALPGKDEKEVDTEDIADDKVTAPAVKELPTLPAASIEPQAEVQENSVEDIKDDPNFALYVDCPSAISSPPPATIFPSGLKATEKMVFVCPCRV